MCIHQKYVTNPYTGQRIYVKCGKCDACKQEKADRLTSRLNNHSSNLDKVAIFCALTYEEKFVPYVKRCDIENKDLYELPIYRDFTVRTFNGRFIVRDHSCNPIRLDSISLLNPDTGEVNRENISFHGNLWKKDRGFLQDRVGVIYYKDYQNFCKRLRINLQRRYGKGFGNVEFFGTSEFGETHFRPHFHALVYCDKDTYQRVIAAICDSWPYASRDDLERSTKLAINAAAYVSGYVNSPSDIPRCLTSLTKQKHSFSRSVGIQVSYFSLSKILEMVDKGLVAYPRQTKVNGVPAVFNVPVPKYVINRYFPIFKGLCRIDVHTLACLLRKPSDFIGFHRHEALTDYDKRGNSDTHNTIVRLENAKNNYIALTGKTDYDFSIDYIRTWNCFKNTLYKLSFEQDIPMNERYDNINDLFNGYVRNDTLSHYLKDKKVLPSDANEFKSNIKRSQKSSLKYWCRQKHSKENNYVRVVHLNKNL